MISNATVASKIANFLKATCLYGILLILVITFLFLTPLLILIPANAAASITIAWCRMIIFAGYAVCDIGVQLSGDPKKVRRPCVFVCNHQSLWETIYLQLLFHPLSTVVKKSLLSIPSFGQGLRSLDPIAIDRSTQIQALRQVKEKSIVRLQQGKSILIFPEGTRRPVGQLGAYARSAADIAKQAGVPIIAIAHNSGKYWIDKKYHKKPGAIHVVISNPIIIGDKNSKEYMASIQAWTQHQLDRME